MCGIAALFAPAPTAAVHPLARAMADIVRYRGPDDEGLVVFRGSGLDPEARGGPDTPPDAYAARASYAPARGGGEAADAVAALSHRRLSILDLSPLGHQPMASPDRR